MEEMTLGSLLVRAAIVVVLLATNAFFVAAEFALVASRRTRIEEMVRQGDRKARIVQTALQDLYRQLSAAQLGITLASILLGYVAEDTVAVVLHNWVSSLPPVVSFLGRATFISVVAVLVITALHVVIGEQAPKAWAITNPEVTSRWIAAPLIFFSLVTRPLTNSLNWASSRLVRLLGIRGTPEELENIHSPEEIVMLVKQTHESGRLDDHDVRMIEGVFEFTEKNAREVMTPRTEVIGLPADLRIEQALDRIADAGRSRYPVYQDSLDDVVGIVHVKQMLSAARRDSGDKVSSLMRAPLFVPGTREVEDVLADMQRLKTHMAIVLDEYGGTAGIVTMEDLIEEIVGEIYDEYDEAGPGPTTGTDFITVPGDMEIVDLNKRYGFSINDADYQTIGGFVFGQLGRLPKTGDRVRSDRLTFEVLDMDARRVETVKLIPNEADAEQPPT
jgi:CBS domain containing-hemolysin-like protein